MTLTRRKLLRLGSLGTMAALLPPWRLARTQASSQDPGPSLDRRYLRHGLDVLCNAHASDSFYTGHAGGAIVAAYYLAGEEGLEAGTETVIKAALDHHYGLASSPFPEEEPLPDGVHTVLQSMEDGIDQLCRDGHDVIFLSLALRAMHDLPETVTPSRIRALRRTLETLEPRRSGRGDLDVPESLSSFAEFVLEEFLASTEGGPGQGYSGHLLTHGRAILDLRSLGHEDFAKRCLNAFQLAVKTARPRSPGKDYRAERPRKQFIRPDRKEYWERRVAAGTLELGHLFKYPYGFLGLRRHSKNQALNDVCTENSHRLFRS